MLAMRPILFFFFFNDTATTEIYTLSLHDALPICISSLTAVVHTFASHLVDAAKPDCTQADFAIGGSSGAKDRKSTRLNSSHQIISYAVFCLKKKRDMTTTLQPSVPNTP